MKNGKTLIIIDGTALVYRAFHAIPRTFATSGGLPTNAVYGFTQSIRKIVRDFSPDYIGVAFDVKGPTFRHEIFEEYKATRPPMPDLLSEQIPYIKRVLKAYGIPVLEEAGYEADDIIATVVRRASKEGLKTAIVSSDKDMYQLVDDKTVILDYNSGKEYGIDEVEERFGVGPLSIRELLALAGDASDNIPGVPGIGPKTAVKLLKKYGTIDKIYANIEEIPGGKLKAGLIRNKDQAFLSRDLATLHEEIGFDENIEDLKAVSPDYKELARLFEALEFQKLLKDVLAESRGAQGGAGTACLAGVAPPDAGKPPGFTVVDTEEALSALLKKVKEQRSVSLFFSGDSFASAALTEEDAFYVGATGPERLTHGVINRFLKEVLEDGSIVKNTDNAKRICLYGLKNSIAVSNFRDTSIASYLLNPSRSDHSIGALAFEHLGVIAEGEGRDPAVVASEMACNINEISAILEKKLKEDDLWSLYEEMELPLVSVLARMEYYGIRVDAGVLEDLSSEMGLKLQDMERSIYGATGVEFNINSPKQLAEVLFVRLGLKPIKKTKTGFSTNEEVLKRLAASHEIPEQILNFRSMAKLKSTYVDALLNLIDPKTGRVHTSFNQTVTATGRLSSSRPNLQNIPVRSEMAGRIREAFIADIGFTLFSADYSQIELRIVAHMAGDPALIDAFNKDEDIHTRTASEIFGLAPADITPELRRRAKAINFGIIYGMGPYGLSAELGISMGEAQEYIESYFAHYKAVKAFIDDTIEEAIQRGYTTTLFGRRRFIPELKSASEPVVRFGTRQAVNTPIQGSAADIIKAAMIKIDERLSSGSFQGLNPFRSRMILQIHDELIFEVADDELETVRELVKHEMESVVKLTVPVKVNLKSGPNWRMVE